MKILIFVTIFVIAYVITYQSAVDDYAYATVKRVFLYTPFWLIMVAAVVDNRLPKKYLSVDEFGRSSIGPKTPKVIKIFYFFIMMVCLPLALGFFVATVIAGKWVI
jgi:hypothetical protein